MSESGSEVIDTTTTTRERGFLTQAKKRVTDHVFQFRVSHRKFYPTTVTEPRWRLISPPRCVMPPMIHAGGFLRLLRECDAAKPKQA